MAAGEVVAKWVLGLVWVFSFRYIWVGVVWALLGRTGDGVRGGTCVFIFVVYRIVSMIILGVGRDFFGGRVSDGS